MTLAIESTTAILAERRRTHRKQGTADPSENGHADAVVPRQKANARHGSIDGPEAQLPFCAATMAHRLDAGAANEDGAACSESTFPCCRETGDKAQPTCAVSGLPCEAVLSSASSSTVFSPRVDIANPRLGTPYSSVPGRIRTSNLRLRKPVGDTTQGNRFGDVRGSSHAASGMMLLSLTSPHTSRFYEIYVRLRCILGRFSDANQWLM